MKTKLMSSLVGVLAASAGAVSSPLLAQADAGGAAEVVEGAPADATPGPASGASESGQASTEASTSAQDAAAPVVETIPVETATEPAADEAAEPGSRSRLVEEIIVTAQKREENAQDVPITIQAFSAGMLDALGVKTTQDLQSVTPSLNYGEFVGYSIIFLRGVGTDAFLTADPSVTTYVDGVYLPFSFGQTSDFGAIERVEVLKGPQGTLFGRNAVGGAIAVYTADPDLEELSLDLSTSYGEFSDLILKGTANIPVTDTFAISISGNYHKNDFHYDGTYGDDPSRIKRPFGPEVGRGYRVKTLWRPVESFELMAAHAYNEFNGFSTSVTPVIVPTPLSLGAALVLNPPGTDRLPQPDYQADLDVAGLGYYSKLTYGRIGIFPGPVDIKLYGSHQYTGNYQFYDFDGSTTPIAEFNSPTRDGSGVDADTAELQILSNEETPFSDRVQWVAGAYYFKSQAGFRDPALLYLNVVDPVINAANGFFDLLDRLENPAVDSLLSILRQSPSGAVGFTSGVATDSIAGYAQMTLKFTDWMSLTLGGRYQEEDREVNESGTWIQQLNGDFIKLIDRRDQDDTTTSFSPKAALEFRLADGLLMYGSYQEATKSGTFNAVNIYDTIDFVKPEKLKAYEIGAKTDLFDGVRFNIAGWFYKQKDLQTQFVSLLKGGAVSFETAGAAESKGVEFDLNWQVLPDVVDDLVLIAGGAYVDATYTSYPNASGFEQAEGPTRGLLRQNYDFSGNRVPQAAKYTGSVQLNKTFFLSSMSSAIEVGADYYYNDGFFWTAQNVDPSRERSYSTVGARVSWLYEPNGLRVTAFGTNITDNDHNLQLFTTDFGVVRHQAKPSIYGLRVEVSFR